MARDPQKLSDEVAAWLPPLQTIIEMAPDFSDMTFQVIDPNEISRLRRGLKPVKSQKDQNPVKKS